MRLVGDAANLLRPGRRTHQLHGLHVPGDGLLHPAELLRRVGRVEERLGLTRQEGDRFPIAQKRVVELVEPGLPDASGEQVRAPHPVELMASERHVLEAVQGLERAQVLARAMTELAELVERLRMVGGESKRRLTVQPCPGEVVFREGTEARELHVRLGRVRRVPRERRHPPVGADGTRPVPRLVRRARQGLQRRQVVRLQPEELVERLHRHLRRLVAGGPGCGFGGEEGRGLLVGLARQGTEREVALGGLGVFTPALPDHRLRPERRRAPLPPTGEGGRDVERELMGLRVRDQEREQPLGREGVRLVGVGAAQVEVPRLRELALCNQRLGVGKGTRAFEREQELLVGGRGWGQSSGAEAQPQALG